MLSSHKKTFQSAVINYVNSLKTGKINSHQITLIKSFEDEVKRFMEKYDKNETYFASNPLVLDIMDSHFTQDEMVNAIKNLKKNKSCGLDGLPAEVLVSQSSSLSYPLCILLIMCLISVNFHRNG